MTDAATSAGTYTTADMARLLQVNRKTVAALLADGKIPDPIVNLPKCKRWSKIAMERFLATGRRR